MPEPQRFTLDELNHGDRESFLARLGDTVENAPWVAERLAAERPFPTVDALWQAIMTIIAQAPLEAQIALFQGHPELAGAEAMDGRMSSHSTREQDRLGLTAMHPTDLDELNSLNRRYRKRFGYPCIVALRHQRDVAGVLTTIAARLMNDPGEERRAVLREIGEIVRGRLDLRIAEGASHVR